MQKNMFKRFASSSAACLSMACAVLLVALACALAVPAKAFAADDSASSKVMAYSCDAFGNRDKDYFSISEALEAGYGGKEIYLACDWLLDSTLIINDNKTITINMNGYLMKQTGEGQTIRLYQGANLTLKSKNFSTLDYNGYSYNNGSVEKYSATVGGLVTGNTEKSNSGGIGVDAGATITLDNVVVGGCSGSAMYVGKNTTINLQNGASIVHNKGEAGGIYVKGEEVTIHLDNAHIDYNYATNHGGALYSDEDATRISMKNNSTMSYNHSCNGGGAVYFNKSYYNILCDDLTAEISNNTADADGGGAIYINKKSNKKNEGEIRGVTFKNNEAKKSASHAADGGAIHNEQRYLVLNNCTFTNNVAGEAGGAYYTNGNNCTITNCTITNNVCNTTTYMPNNHEGGGVYVDGHCDINLSGKLIIINNTRGVNGSKDDLFLGNDVHLSYAYMKGSVTTDSKVGVRTGSDEDRRIAKNFTNNGANSFFIDLDEYYVSYGTDDGGDMWQRHPGTKQTYLAKVNGQGTTRYDEGATITADGTSSDSDKVFWRWSESNSTGLVPFGNYVKDIYNPIITYSMPQNDTNLVAEYVSAINDVTLTMDRPVVDSDLPTKATISWGDGKSETVDVTWLEVGGSSVATKAAYGASYTFYVTMNSKYESGGYAFNSNLTTSNVTLMFTDGTKGPSVANAYVDTSSTLCITSNKFDMEKPDVNSVDEDAIDVNAGATQDEVRAALPDYCAASLSGDVKSVMATDKTKANLPSSLFVDGKVPTSAIGKNDIVVEVPLAATDAVKSVEGKYVRVKVNVLPAETPATPTLSPVEGTYNQYTGSATMDSNLKFTVKASCATSNATLQYKVGDAESWTNYTDEGIVLTGTENSKVDVTVHVRALAADGETSSSEVKATYTLNDTLKKTISVNCSDTALYNEGEQQWSKSFDVTDDLGDTIVITAPEQEGHVFDHWVWNDAPEGTNLSGATLQIKDFQLAYSGKIEAVYVPVLDSVNIELTQPVAGETLASTAKVTVGTGSDAKDITQLFAYDGSISWLPASSDGKAAFGTSYTAMASLNVKSDSGYKYKISDSAKLLVNGQAASQGSVIVGSGDSKTAMIAFTATAGSKKASLVDTSFTETLSFVEANVYYQEQAGVDDTSWGLPRLTTLKYESGDEELVDINWNKVEGFNPDATGAQTLPVTGEVVLPSDVDKSSVSNVVTATLNITAPQVVSTPTVDVNPGTYNEPQVVELSATPDDAKIYYTTDGSEPTEKSTEYIEGIKVSTPTTIKARAYYDGMLTSEIATFEYTINPYTVTFDSAGGTPVDSQSVYSGGTVTKPADPTLEGYNFVGWYKQDGTKYDFDSEVHGNVALHAHWSVISYTVTFDSKGGSAVDSQAVDAGGTATKPANPTREGYKFEGWTLEDGTPYDFSSKVTGDLTLCASWSKISYTVKFDSSGGSAVEAQTVDAGGTATKPADPTWNGFEFEGWYQADGTAYDFSSKVTGDLTLYASWSRNVYVVKFDSAGGSAVDAQTVVGGNAAKQPADPTWNGYKFEGWTLEDGTAYDFTSPVMGNLTLYASWSAIDVPTTPYLVVFDSAGGSAVDAQTVMEGKTVEKPADPTLEGFTFDGWYLEDGTAYDFETPVTSHLVLYAHWSKSGEPQPSGGDDGDKGGTAGGDQSSPDTEKAAAAASGGIAQTGDSVNIAGPLALLFTAVVMALVAVAVLRRRKQ